MPHGLDYSFILSKHNGAHVNPAFVNSIDGLNSSDIYDVMPGKFSFKKEFSLNPFLLFSNNIVEG